MQAPYRSSPKPTWPDHNGEVVVGATYAIDPDPSLGTVDSAWTNQDADGFRQPHPSWVWVGAILLGGITLAYTKGWLSWRTEVDSFVSIIVLGAALVVTRSARRQRPACSFVGEAGFEKYERGCSIELVRFADVCGLWYSGVDRYVRGTYHGTKHSYVWRHMSGRTLYKSSYFSRDKWA